MPESASDWAETETAAKDKKANRMYAALWKYLQALLRALTEQLGKLDCEILGKYMPVILVVGGRRSQSQGCRHEVRSFRTSDVQTVGQSTDKA